MHCIRNPNVTEVTDQVRGVANFALWQQQIARNVTPLCQIFAVTSFKL